MFLPREEVIFKIKDAIINRKILLIKYQHVSEDSDIVERKKAPFDIGTTNPEKIEAHKNNLYAFCYDHIDRETGLKKEFIHPINIEHIISITETGAKFDPNELTDINFKNTGYDYRTCNFALLPKRRWF